MTDATTSHMFPAPSYLKLKVALIQRYSAHFVQQTQAPSFHDGDGPLSITAVPGQRLNEALKPGLLIPLQDLGCILPSLKA